MQTNKLASLKPSFSTLSNEDRLKLILAIRLSRRTPKKPIATDSNGDPIVKKPRKINTSKRAPTKADARSLLSAMTPEVAAELLALLEEK
jgi:hypothetical protein